MMNKRAQLLKKQITSHLLYHPFTTQLYQPQYIHHHILHRISPDNQLQCRTINFSAKQSTSVPDNQLQCRNNPSFLQLCRISVTCSSQQKKTHQPTNQLISWMPVLQTSCPHLIDPAAIMLSRRNLTR